MSCPEIAARLSELLDGDLPRDERAAVEAHLEGCADCRELLAGLRRVREAARALPKLTAPESLWQRVRADFAAETGRAPEAKVLAFPWRRFGSVRALAAAAAIVLAASAGVYWATHRVAAPVPAAVTAERPSPAAVLAAQSVEAELDQADQHYQKAIASLELAAKDGQAVLDPQTAAVLQKNLGIVDQAITESRAAVKSEPTSEAAQSSLFDALQRKVALLKDTIALINEMRKGNAAGTAEVVGTIGKRG
jgi:anti-sigma factor RsiW